MVKNERPIDYQMTKRMFDGILATRTEDEKRMNPYSYVMNFINESYGLRGTVTHISIAID